METKSLRTVVVDDHALVRKNIVLLLERTGHAIVVGQAENGCTALTLIKELHPDLAVVDVLMPQMDGFALLRQLKQQPEPAPQVLLTSVFAYNVFRQQGQLAGAAGFIPKQQLSKLLPQAIEALLQGQTFFNSIGTTKTPPFLSEPEQYDYSEHKL